MEREAAIMTGEQFPQILKQLYAELINREGELNYLKPLVKLQKSKSAFTTVNDLYVQVLAEYASYVRQYQWAARFSFPQSAQEPHSPFSLQDAKPVILQQAKDRQVVMINEAHTKPEHRLFATTLLLPLYQLGFRVLAMEALSWGDTLINQRKYPLGSSGTYTKEPYFADFVRTALALGFSVIPYEQKELSHSIQDRENQQAENLAQFLKENSNAKIVVFAGHSHSAKAEDKENHIKSMATLFQEKTGINPLSIEQTHLQPRADINTVSVFFKENQPWFPERFRTFYDMMLIYPKKPIAYLHEKLNKKKFTIFFGERIINNKKEKLLQIFNNDEYVAEKNKAIPIEQKIMLSTPTKMTLYLKPQALYFVCIKDIDNNILSSQKIVLSHNDNTKISLN